MYDKFEAMQVLAFFPFRFTGNRYKIWKKGDSVDSGENEETIIAEVTHDDIFDENLSVKITTPVIYENSKFENILKPEFIFKVIITSTDRLILATIPNISNQDCLGLRTFRNTLGVNTDKYLDEHEPYGCSLFLIDGEIVKIAFTINSPETLIEFYND